MKKLVIRVDSGLHIGIGHLARCITLANGLKNDFKEIHFITKNHLGFIQNLIPNCFYTHVIDGGVKDSSLVNNGVYTTWLGSSVDEDVTLSNQVINKIGGADLVVVDHYSLDKKYEENLITKKVVAIDDLMNRSHSVQLLIDQNITADQDSYKELVSPTTRLLLGPGYAILRDEFYHLRTKVDEKDFGRTIGKILVYFGGMDASSETIKFARAIDQQSSKYQFTFILKENHPDYQELLGIQKSFSFIRVLNFVENLGQEMMNSDLFVGAGGTTSWERASLGVASTIVSVADNQVGNCRELHRLKAAYYFGEAHNISMESWKKFMNITILDNELWANCRKNSFSMVDGRGVQRISQVIREMGLC